MPTESYGQGKKKWFLIHGGTMVELESFTENWLQLILFGHKLTLTCGVDSSLVLKEMLSVTFVVMRLNSPQASSGI
jgi:hypothetical protein